VLVVAVYLFRVMALAAQEASWGVVSGRQAGCRYVRVTTCAGDAQMNRYLKRWLIGFLVAGAGVALAWSGYRVTGVLLGWIGSGIAAYGIGGGLIERIRQTRKRK
jgi:hypothetical protein